MSNLSINLNLLKFKSCGVMSLTGKTGTKRCIVIPIEDNHLVEGEKGVYANFVGWETDKLTDNRTHMVKQSFNKDVFEKMTDDDKKNQPIFGDIRPMGAKATGEETYSAPAKEDESLPF